MRSGQRHLFALITILLLVYILVNVLQSHSYNPLSSLPFIGSRKPSPVTIPVLTTWQIQYTGELDLTVDVQVFNLDLWDTTPSIIQELRERGIFVMCYFNAGAYEEWRPDASAFAPVVLGKDLADWPGERWLDIRRIDILGPIMNARLDLAVAKGCHGVDPDNVNGYTNDTGFALTAEDQLAYNRFLASAAHERGLTIGLKNDIDQIPELVEDFDWIINESCFRYQECTALLPFKEAGKPVFVIEYDQAPEHICFQSQQMGLNTLIKHRKLDAYRIDCHQFGRIKR